MKIETILQMGFTPIDEGGYCKRIYTSPLGKERPITTAIEYILPAGGTSTLHSLDADELWIHLGGGELELVRTCEQGEAVLHRLKPGEHFTFPAGCVFGAREVSGEDVHVICVVSPGYTDEGFRLVDAEEIRKDYPAGWEKLRCFLRPYVPREL